ncbi:hypothetical protein KHM83_13835 [Fusibacter paucivorans]|uniref:MarR family transcriptional regulator n=1 Tax=Fusibacter paucivorans TaxID=76009 RepID=A0ABS5PRG7_9FIRM|nr:hypothetical protein [Fusibacter paucivorans]MBS7527760.1 hypothetical protein [Fusibacter paucivorans]
MNTLALTQREIETILALKETDDIRNYIIDYVSNNDLEAIVRQIDYFRKKRIRLERHQELINSDGYRAGYIRCLEDILASKQRYHKDFDIIKVFEAPKFRRTVAFLYDQDHSLSQNELSKELAIPKATFSDLLHDPRYEDYFIIVRIANRHYIKLSPYGRALYEKYLKKIKQREVEALKINDLIDEHLQAQRLETSVDTMPKAIHQRELGSKQQRYANKYRKRISQNQNVAGATL